MRPAYLYETVRTPRGKAKASGGLADIAPHDLLKPLYQALEQRCGLRQALVRGMIEEVILGCVTQHGEQAGNIAKTSLHYAGWPSSIAGLTINRFCSSGLDAISLAALKVQAGQGEGFVAGGIEMMSRVPMLSDGATVFTDPVLAGKCQMLMMGSGADLVATLCGVSREQADHIALTSQQRALAARDNGYFRSIVPIVNPVKNITVQADECPREGVSMADLAELEPAFAKLGAQYADAVQLAAYPDLAAINHVHTAGNSPAMADGAALALVGGAALGEQLGMAPRARIVASTTVGDDPLQVISGCVAATEKLLAQQNISAAEVGLFELHEAFAATSVKAMQRLGISADKLNVNGGVIALGHPMGATGAIMAATLLDEMERRDVRLGVVAASGAAGTGSALLLERC